MNMNKKMVVVGIVIVALIILYFSTRPSGENGLNAEAIAKALTAKGAVMYGLETCSHCKEQKALFGESFRYVNYVSCDENQLECIKLGITGVPAWIINNKTYQGVQSLEDLKKL